MKTLAAVIVVAASLLSTAHAQDVAVPDLSGSTRPEVIREGAKYFFFHQEGVSFEKAQADFSECFLYLQPASWESVKMNRFVPWVTQPDKRTDRASNMYGLVGLVIVEAFEGALAHRDYQAKLRMCMEPRGYLRYGVAESIWERVNKLPAEQSIAVQAKIASGPAFGKQVQDK